MPARSISYFSFLAFLATLHASLTLYINSSVITLEPLGIAFITPVFIFSAIGSIIFFYYTSNVLRKIGNGWFLVLTCAVEGASLLALAAHPTELLLFLALSIHLIMAPLIGLSLDIFFEYAMVDEGGTGVARGFLLTFGNTALVISPLIVGILADGSFSVIYLLSAIILAGFLLCSIRTVREFKDPHYHQSSLAGILSTIKGHLGAVITTQLVLRIFYSFAAIYMPLLLLARGFSWGEIGIILGIALLPFMLFELPLGHLSDKFLKERETLVVGFCILAAATSLLAYDIPISLLMYALIFFLTRTGASMIEITSETNFFRSVDAKDASAITLFRMTTAIGTLIGVGLAGVALFFINLPDLFLIFGIFVLLGIPAALHIKDSR